MPLPQNVQRLIQAPAVTPEAKVALVTLYALRYERNPSSQLPMLVDLLTAVGGVAPRRADLVAKVLTYHHSLLPATGSGASGSGGPAAISELFESSGIFSGARNPLKQLSLKGVENVYTQHSPRLEATLQALVRGRLREAAYPFVDGAARDKPQDIVVFIVGGATYEEARTVAAINAASPGVRVVLGGTTVHNAATFLDEVEDAVSMWPEPPPTSAAGRLRRELARR